MIQHLTFDDNLKELKPEEILEYYQAFDPNVYTFIVTYPEKSVMTTDRVIELTSKAVDSILANTPTDIDDLVSTFALILDSKVRQPEAYNQLNKLGKLNFLDSPSKFLNTLNETIAFQSQPGSGSGN